MTARRRRRHEGHSERRDVLDPTGGPPAAPSDRFEVVVDVARGLHRRVGLQPVVHVRPAVDDVVDQSDTVGAPNPLFWFTKYAR